MLFRLSDQNDLIGQFNAVIDTELVASDKPQQAISLHHATFAVRWLLYRAGDIQFILQNPTDNPRHHKIDSDLLLAQALLNIIRHP